MHDAVSGAWWNWSDAIVFIAVFTALRIAFIWLATQAIVSLIPEGGRCVTCDEETLPLVHEGGWRMLGHRFHRRFCLSCQWEGIVRTPLPYAPRIRSTRFARRSSSTPASSR